MLVCLLFTFGVKAQITREQADSIVLNQLYVNNIDHIDIYSFEDMLSSNDEIQLLDGSSVYVPYSTCWTYVINNAPMETWHDSLTFCFLDALTGNHSLFMTDIPLETFWLNLEKVSLMDWPPSNHHDLEENPRQYNENDHLWAILIVSDYSRSGGGETQDLRTMMSDLSCVYTALNRYGFKEKSEEEPSHIIVVVPSDFEMNNCDPDLNHSGGFYDSDDIHLYYTFDHQNLEFLHEYFSNLSGESNTLTDIRKLTEEDQLFIYFTGNGVDNPCSDRSAIQFKGENSQGNNIKLALYDDVFTEWLRNIECSQMTLMVQNPHGGGFAERFLEDISNPNCMCKNRIAQSATTAEGYSFGEYYNVWQRQEGNRGGDSGLSMVNEFTYYWSAACLGYYPVLNVQKIDGVGWIFNDGPWNAYSDRMIGSMDWSIYFPEENMQYHPHIDCESLYKSDLDNILSLKEAFDFANRMNTWTDDRTDGGYFNPRYPVFLEFPSDDCSVCHGPEIPIDIYESTFTAEAATLRGYEGQVDGLGVNSGTATQPYRLCGDLWVGPDSDLTMWDDIYSPEDVKIYIEPTGMLTMDGCTFDKLPETGRGMWQGVQVWGDSNENQRPEHGKYKQGVLVMKNDAGIRNALCAAELWHPGDWNSTGGIIHATNAHFINNTKAIHALNYRNMVNGNECDYLAQFRNCEFNVGDGYIGSPDALFYKHVDLANVRGVKFYGCDFGLKCVNANISDWTEGIAAYNAGFTVSGYTQGATHKPSTFDGFFNGVQALNDNNGMPEMFSVKNSTFTNNDYGIFARAADVPVILNNTFSIGLDNWYSCSAAIQLEGIASFVVEGNSITKAPDCTNDNFGIIIKDSQTEGNQVYLNDLDGLYCGNLAWGNNHGTENEQKGIEYACNSNAYNVVDFYVKYVDENTDIQQNQGNLVTAAQNTFSPNNESSNLRYNFYNDGNNTVHYYVYQYSGDDVYPHIVNGSKVFVNDKSSQANTCQPHYGGGGNAHNGSSTPVLSTAQKQQRQADYANALNTYNSVKNVYDRLTDGGSTNSTVADIRSAMPSDMWELRSKLLGSSPYLSEEVLKETADRDDVFTESILFEILASNPDELRKGDIIKYVEDKEHPLPEYMVDILRQLSTGTTTYKTLLLNSMASSRHDYRQAAADMVRSILADSIVDMNELRGWLANMNDLSADRQIISTYMAEGDFGTAFSLANMLPALYEFDATALAEHDDYMELLGLYRDLHNDGRSTLQLTNGEAEDVEDIAINGTGLPQYMAQSLLEATNERYHFDECPELDFQAPVRGASQGYTQEDLSKAMGLSVSAKPNPATTWVAIDFTLPGDAKAATVEIINSLGEKVMQSQLNGNVGQKVLDLRELANGVYTITILCGEYYQTEKLVVAK